MAVGVAGGLREDDPDEHVERVGGRGVLRHAVGAFEVLNDVANRPLVVAGRCVRFAARSGERRVGHVGGRGRFGGFVSRGSRRGCAHKIRCTAG